MTLFSELTSAQKIFDELTPDQKQLKREQFSANFGVPLPTKGSLKKFDEEMLLEDAAGNSFGLAGCSARFHMKAYGATTLKVDAVADITDEDNGRVEYTWASGDTDTAGTYYGEIEVTFADNSVETFPNSGYFTIIIQEDLD